MLAVISPAKTLDFASEPRDVVTTRPAFHAEAEALAAIMAKRKPAQLKRLMDISDELARLNHARFQTWSPSPAPDAERAALYAFRGDTYLGLDAPSLKPRQIAYAQDHLRILSGLYGVLRPLDTIQPYRLEMGTALRTPRGRNLYAWWGELPARALAEQAATLRTRWLVNLASQEYFGAVDTRALDLEVVTPVFQDWSGGRYRTLGLFAKRARGMMARYLIEHRCRKPAELLAFDTAGYAYDPEASTPDAPVFRRRAATA